jgi:hypothetical protein
VLNQQTNRVAREKLRCIGRKISKPRLIHYTHNHRAIMIEVEGYPAVCEVVKEWRILRKQTYQKARSKNTRPIVQRNFS